MNRKPHPISGRALWKTLALWMLPMLVVLMSTGLLLTVQSLREVADSAYDRSLSGAIRAIDLRISTESGGIGIELPYPLFESFQATADGEVLFRVSTDDGLVQIGDALLPAPPRLRLNEVTFYNATYFGRSIRVGAYMRALDPPLYGAKQSQNLIIEVAETTGSRQEFLRTVLTRTILRDFSALLAVTLLLALGLHAGLKPLRALRDRLDQRRSDDLRQVDPTGLPLDVQPLVQSVNRLVDRHRLQAEAQRRFIEDASHQLKTPLAVLRAQIDLASQTDKRERLDEIHAAMREIVTRSARLTSQLLSLAHARNDAMWRDGSDHPIDVSKLLDDVVRLHVGSARQRRILLEVDVAVDVSVMNAPEALLFEAVSNLIDNAIIASLRNGRVILSAYRQGTASFIEVRDFGTGLSDAMLEKLQSGQRFNINEGHRSEPTSSGLGLTIVQQIMKTLEGELILKNMPDGGLSARMRIPNTK